MNGPGSFLSSEWEQLVRGQAAPPLGLNVSVPHAWHRGPFFFSSDLSIPRSPGARCGLGLGTHGIKHARA